jgi:hypothetical protein
LIIFAPEEAEIYKDYLFYLGRRGRDSMVVAFTTTYAISAYHH